MQSMWLSGGEAEMAVVIRGSQEGPELCWAWLSKQELLGCHFLLPLIKLICCLGSWQWKEGLTFRLTNDRSSLLTLEKML